MWIETKYDYTTNVKDLKLEIFRDVISTNLDVNKKVEEFQAELKVTQDDVGKYLIERQTEMEYNKEVTANSQYGDDDDEFAADFRDTRISTNQFGRR